MPTAVAERVDFTSGLVIVQSRMLLSPNAAVAVASFRGMPARRGRVLSPAPLLTLATSFGRPSHLSSMTRYLERTSRVQISPSAGIFGFY